MSFPPKHLSCTVLHIHTESFLSTTHWPEFYIVGKTPESTVAGLRKAQSLWSALPVGAHRTLDAAGVKDAACLQMLSSKDFWELVTTTPALHRCTIALCRLRALWHKSRLSRETLVRMSSPVSQNFNILVALLDPYQGSAQM